MRIYDLDKASFDSLDRCLQKCLDSYRICVETASYCIEKGDQFSHLNHLLLLLDCANACHQTVAGINSYSHLENLGSSNNALKGVFSQCAQITSLCASSLSHLQDDLQIQACKKVVLEASSSCANLAGLVS